MKSTPALFLALLLLMATAANSQKLILRGSVRDSVAYLHGASVAVLDNQQTRIVHTITDSTGRFQLQVAQQGTFQLEIRHAGFDPFQQSIVLNRDLELPAITLSRNRIAMQEVVVQGKQAVVEIGNDPTTLVYNVSRTLDAAGQTALETLKKAPGVSVDNNSSISLNGRTGVTIMLDGRPTYLSGRELIDLLQSMPSSSIRSIEIINSPGAKYDAAGNAGIINIRTLKTYNRGLNGSIGAGFSYGISLRQNTDVSLTYRKGKLQYFLYYNHFLGEYTYEYGSDRLQNNRNYSSATYDRDKRKRVNSRVGMDYAINDRHSIGWMVSANFIPGGGLTDTRTVISAPGSSITDQILDAYNDYYLQQTRRYNGNINYQYEDKAGHKLNVDADMGYFNKENRNLQSNRYLDAGEVLQHENLYRTFNEINIRLKAVKVDYAANLWKGKFETGVKIAGVKSVNDGQFYHVKSTDSLDQRRSNYFSFEETISSGYINYKTNYGKWSWQAGLRIEHTDNKSDTNQRNYTNLFPAISIGYKPGDAHNFSLAYSRRIDRPAYPDLNPFVYLLDELSYWQGNPYLQPQLTDRLNLQYVYRNSTVIGISYAQTSGYSARITDSVNGNQIVMIPRNVGNQKAIALTLTQTKQLYKWWELTLNASILRLHNEINFRKDYDITQWTGRGNLVQRFRINATLSAELTGLYNSRRLTAANEINRATSQVDIAVQKTLGTHATIRLAFNDIYKGTRSRTRQDMDQFHISSYGYYETRQVRLNFTWKLIDKNSKPVKSRTSALETENGRVR